MFQTLKNAWRVPDLRSKMIFTLVVLVIFRLGCMIPVPFIDSEGLAAMFGTSGAYADSVLAYFNVLSGEAFSQATIFALNVSPYITSSIIIQLLTVAIPALEKLSKSGPEGQKKIQSITRYSTVALALIMAYGYYVTIRNNDLLFDTGFFAGLIIVLSFVAGSSIVMWLAEKLNGDGIGNGVSMILFANIVSSFPTMIARAITMVKSGMGWWLLPIVVVIFIALIVFVVFMTNAERRLPVQYAKKQVGRKMYGGMSSHLPIKLNMSGVMPIIFANSIIMLPATLALIIPTDGRPGWATFVNFFSQSGPMFPILTFVLIVAFSYFYLMISFNPVEVANNLQKNGGTILGYRPGASTAAYIKKVLNRITLIGAVFLGIIAVLPTVLSWFSPYLSYLSFGGSSLLIVVGVVLETVRDLESQITMRHYKGFLG